MKKIISILLISISILSCEKENEEPTLGDSKQSTIQFSPNNTNWFLREYPDSVVVKLSGGEPPYVITERPGFSSKAIIKGNELHIFPLSFNSSLSSESERIGYDFLIVQDNYGNTNQFNIKIDLQKYRYIDSSLTFNISGDTSVKITQPPHVYANYDGFYDYLGFDFYLNNNNTRFYISIENIDSVGEFETHNTSFYYSELGRQYRLRAEDKIKVTVSHFSLNRIAGSFSHELVSSNNSVITVNCQFNFKRIQ
ncbi:MAG: hypothetical protein CMC96_00845 [Flavobacteriales bacterium]|nr:hypothetical protein [Flavobacteriales bacterium]|tara:strand:- start:67831 stop:68589 length:759 start_codon:yes stop_codon:yes gene_type:complete